MKSRQERLEWHMADRCKHVIWWCSGKNYSVHHYQFRIFQFLSRKRPHFWFSHLEVNLSMKAICACCFSNVSFMHKLQHYIKRWLERTLWSHIVCAQVQLQSHHFWLMFVQPVIKDLHNFPSLRQHLIVFTFRLMFCLGLVFFPYHLISNSVVAIKAHWVKCSMNSEVFALFLKGWEEIIPSCFVKTNKQKNPLSFK